ncbi:MAG: NADH-quinone oxidoreductase subunit NuoG [Chloroflexi bacterium]|nr:NADH-quinone oxidoreductase subunit NuoG [Chloroflexota bacterium]
MSELVKNEAAQNMVTLTIDDHTMSVPEGTLVVDAARSIGLDIPVFCYHPKMEPVGMCRMCLVEIGTPMRDRTTSEPILEDDGSPKIQFFPNLMTGCTFRASEGMVVRGYTEKVTAARKEVLEFLLTSHPLDCPTCDKGGECPLQNLTMQFGDGESRFIYDEKMHSAKHVALGDLIFLDRERCIQCARCTRFQDEIVDDQVIGFSNRGRALEIVTFSDPGFDSYWSGNTTDICPVGALTTADFRFGARPWEMNASASICNHCAVGCNLTFNTRREVKSGGEKIIKRVMPRQNEAVNEIWICDKGRFAYHFTASDQRLNQPLIRKDGKLVPSSWELALDLVTSRFKNAGENLVTLAGGRLSNEDLFNLAELSAHLGGDALLYSDMAGGDLVSRLGVGEGTNFSDMGPETAILVVACNLEEEAPLWWLRIKQAAERGAKVIVANPRKTKLDRSAIHNLRYEYGQEAGLVTALLSAISPKQPKSPAFVNKLAKDKEVKAAAKALSEAENTVILFGSEGTSYAASAALAQACANLLIASGHIGRPNNGLIGVWDKGNAQGAWDMGLRPSEDLDAALKTSQAVYISAADPAGDSKQYASALKKADFVVVQELYMTATAELADVVLPAQAFTEREGTYTSGERRVQRFYPAVPSLPDLLPDFGITAEIAGRLGLELEKTAPASVMLQIAEVVPDYAELTYQKLAKVEKQFPLIGREDVYYGGTSYQNSQGLGVQLKPAAQNGDSPVLVITELPEVKLSGEELLAVPVTRLLDLGNTVTPSEVLVTRLAKPHVALHPQDAEKLGVEWGSKVKLILNGSTQTVLVEFDNSMPHGVVLVPRSLGIPIISPTPATIKVL